MRASAVTAFGEAPTVMEVPEPTPEAGELLVRVHASSVNDIDRVLTVGKVKAGNREHRFPLILGSDFAGTVEAIGEGVDGYRVGDAVFGVPFKGYFGAGSFAELVTTPVATTAHIPAGMDFRTAAVLPTAAATGKTVVDELQPAAGQLILVSGATGSVGSIVTQLSVAAGAIVIGTALPGESSDHIRSLGATYVVDYSESNGISVVDQVRAIAPDGVDAIAHLAGDAVTLLTVLKPEGRLASPLGVNTEVDPRATAILGRATTATLEQLAIDVRDGRLSLPVARTYTLAEVPVALADFGTGILGKLAVMID